MHPRAPGLPPNGEPLPYPLNLPEEEKFAVLRSMTPAERLKLGWKLSDAHRWRWLAELRSQFPSATEEEFRAIVIAKVNQESEEEYEVFRRMARRETSRMRGQLTPPTQG